MAVELKPDDTRAMQNWALSLAMQAARLERSNAITQQEAEQMYESAIEKLNAALVIDRNDGRTHVIWGNLLLGMGTQLSQKFFLCSTTL